MVSWEYFEDMINYKSNGKYKVIGAYNKWRLVRLKDSAWVNISPFVSGPEMEDILNSIINYIREEEMASKEKLERVS